MIKQRQEIIKVKYIATVPRYLHIIRVHMIDFILIDLIDLHFIFSFYLYTKNWTMCV